MWVWGSKEVNAHHKIAIKATLGSPKNDVHFGCLSAELFAHGAGGMFAFFFLNCKNGGVKSQRPGMQLVGIFGKESESVLFPIAVKLRSERED